MYVGLVGGEGGEWMRGLGFGFTNYVGTGAVLHVYIWVVVEWVVYVGNRLGAWISVGKV